MSIFQSQVLNGLKLRVYHVRIYDVRTDEWVISRRMATEAGAEMMGGVIIEDSVAYIESDQLERGESWTARDFKP